MPRTRNQSRCCGRVQTRDEPQQRKSKAISKARLSATQLRSLLRSRFQSNSNRPGSLNGALTQSMRPDQVAIAELLPTDKMSCPICLQYLIYPTLTECGHALCLACAEESLKHKPTCPLCRKNLHFQQFKPSILLKQLLENRVEQQLQEQAVQLYKERTASFQKREVERKVSKQLKVGDLIDFWNQRKWKEGKIVSINITPTDILYTVQVPQENRFSEAKKLEFSSQSRLIAKHRTFSREAEVSFLGRAQFRIQIFDFRDSLQQSLFLSMMQGGRRMEVSLRDEEGEDSLMRFAMSLQPRGLN